jgi:hypothetical protein
MPTASHENRLLRKCSGSRGSRSMARRARSSAPDRSSSWSSSLESTRRRSKRNPRSLRGERRLTKREHARRNALPEHLPRREKIIAVEGEERLCVCCGEERCRIGYEQKEVLDMEPARYFVRVIKREKLACRKCPEGGVVTGCGRGPQDRGKGQALRRCGSSMCSSRNIILSERGSKCRYILNPHFQAVGYEFFRTIEGLAY